MLFSKKIKNNDKNEMSEEKNVYKAPYIPTPFLIIAILMIVFIVVSWICKSLDISTDILVKKDPSDIHKGFKVVSKPIVAMGILDIFTSIWHGFISKSGIIVFVLAIGSMMAVLNKTKAMDAGIEKVVRKLKGKEIFLIPILMILFGLGGTVYGMLEETIVFFPILIPIFIKAGYGPMTAILTVILSCGAGILSSAVNPFSVGIATATANGAVGHGKEVVTVGTMMITRWILFIIAIGIAIAFVMLYAKKVKKGFVAKGVDEELIKKRFDKEENIEFTIRRKIALGIFISVFTIMILAYLPWTDWLGKNPLKSFNNSWNKYAFWAATSNTNAWTPWGQWYLISLSGLFILAALIIFLINKADFINEPTEEQLNNPDWKSPNKEKVFISTMINGAKDLLPVSLIIAIASGLVFILKTTNIGPLIANQTQSVGDVGIIAFGLILLLIAILLGFIMPSSSGFAAAIIPIFATIAASAFKDVDQEKIVGYVILIYLLAHGITNLLTPTNASLVAYTEFCGISYVIWIKETWKIIFVYFILSVLTTIVVGALIMHNIII